MEIANVIVSGVRIYLPPDNVLPKPSTDMLTFAVVKDRDLSLTTCLWCTGMDAGNWPRKFYKETEQAIMAAVKIGEKFGSSFHI